MRFPYRRGHLGLLPAAALPQAFPLTFPPSYRALQPDGEQTIRAGGSSPRLTAASTGLRPCVLKASRVSGATEPVSSWPITAKETSTVVQTSRPSEAVDLIDQEAPMLSELGGTLADSLTLHPSATRLTLDAEKVLRLKPQTRSAWLGSASPDCSARSSALPSWPSACG